MSTFSWTGPRALNDIIKKELLVGKSAEELSSIWKHYHDDKESVYGLVYSGSEGQTFVKHAKESPFFIHPIFRDNGYFMLLSQFYHENNVFLFCYLEDYKMDPAGASPLMTCAVFNDYASSKEEENDANIVVVDDDESLTDDDDNDELLDLSLVRAETLTSGISDDESLQIVTNLRDLYLDKKDLVHLFNSNPEKFDVDDYISQQNQSWKKGQGNE